MPKKRKSTKKEEKENPPLPLGNSPEGDILLPGSAIPPLRAVSLFGDLDDEQMNDICQNLLFLKHMCLNVIPVNEEGEPLPPDPINFYISTWGGDALSMFAIYDLMRFMREECPIYTFGIGKVMSAGVLLLAAGTKGERRIGKHTRIMMHSVRGTHYGNIHSLQNEMDETLWIQKQLLEALVEETSLTKRKINDILNKKVDVYLSAEDAVEMGIADIIV
ncbi:MAG: putative capsid assembly protease C [Prokaryotic dsDNA virus sp.]|nr:MAG: putative capsid assembly protease C [Prokaryotic dsDNA virus sp.]|tara:strand:- start:2987 stop:3643 length:657 start_codon:yes stop_codon:yes gene_type:complete